MITLATDFAYREPKEDQPDRFEILHAGGRDFAEVIVGECPTSPERTLAVRKIQEAIMWAKASIEVNE